MMCFSVSVSYVAYGDGRTPDCADKSHSRMKIATVCLLGSMCSLFWSLTSVSLSARCAAPLLLNPPLVSCLRLPLSALPASTQYVHVLPRCFVCPRTVV